MSIVVGDTFYESSFLPKSFRRISTGYSVARLQGNSRFIAKTRDEVVAVYCADRNISYIKPINELRSILGYKVIDEIEPDKYLLEDGRIVAKIAFMDSCLNENHAVAVCTTPSKRAVQYIASVRCLKTQRQGVLSDIYTQKEINELYFDPYTNPKLKDQVFDFVTFRMSTGIGIRKIRGRHLKSLHRLIIDNIGQDKRIIWMVDNERIYMASGNKIVSNVSISSLLHDINPIFEKYGLSRIDPPLIPIPDLWKNIPRGLVTIARFVKRTQTKDMINGVKGYKEFRIIERKYSLAQIDDAYDYLLSIIEQLQKQCDKYHLNHTIPIPTRGEFKQIAIDKIAMTNEKVVTTKSNEETDKK